MSGARTSTLEARARVTAALTTALPGLAADEAAATLAGARAWLNRPLRELDAFLTATPGALTVPVDDFPVAWVRVAHALHAAGHRVPLPRCATCHAVTMTLVPGPGGRVCTACAPRREPKLCARCGQLGVILARRAEGGICRRCYRVDPATHDECVHCGRRTVVAARDSAGTAVCERCWQRPMRVCSSCGVTGPAHSNGPDGAWCAVCYRKKRQPRRRCVRCGQLAPIASRDLDGDVCLGCYRRPTVQATCSVCGRDCACLCSRAGAWYCVSCQPRPERPCARCRRSRPVAANWPIGPVCYPCYTRVRTTPGECAHCHRPRPLIARDVIDGDEVGICGPCAGVTVDYGCRSCDSGAGAYADGRCARCVLTDRLTDLLAGPDGRPDGPLRPVAQALARVDNPEKYSPGWRAATLRGCWSP